MTNEAAVFELIVYSYGALLSVPSNVAPLQNSTFEMLPLSEALAVTTKGVPATNDWLALVRLTIGAVLPAQGSV